MLLLLMTLVMRIMRVVTMIVTVTLVMTPTSTAALLLPVTAVLVTHAHLDMVLLLLLLLSRRDQRSHRQRVFFVEYFPIRRMGIVAFAVKQVDCSQRPDEEQYANDLNLWR